MALLSSGWARQCLADLFTARRNRKQTKGQTQPHYRPDIEILEDRLAPASSITIATGVYGSGSLDHFLTAGAGTITATQVSADPSGTLSTAALQTPTATTTISLTAPTSITFNDLGGTLALNTGPGHSVTFQTLATGTFITFVNTANTLTAAGANLSFIAATSLTLGNQFSSSGNVSLTAGTNIAVGTITTAGAGGSSINGGEGSAGGAGGAGGSITISGGGSISTGALLAFGGGGGGGGGGYPNSGGAGGGGGQGGAISVGTTSGGISVSGDIDSSGGGGGGGGGGYYPAASGGMGGSGGSAGGITINAAGLATSTISGRILAAAGGDGGAGSPGVGPSLAGGGGGGGGSFGGGGGGGGTGASGIYGAGGGGGVVVGALFASGGGSVNGGAIPPNGGGDGGGAFGPGQGSANGIGIDGPGQTGTSTNGGHGGTLGGFGGGSGGSNTTGGGGGAGRGQVNTGSGNPGGNVSTSSTATDGNVILSVNTISLTSSAAPDTVYGKNITITTPAAVSSVYLTDANYASAGNTYSPGITGGSLTNAGKIVGTSSITLNGTAQTSPLAAGTYNGPTTITLTESGTGHAASNAGMVTPAEYVALVQVATTGTQSLTLTGTGIGTGVASGGNFTVASANVPGAGFSALVLPAGVTENASVASLSYSGTAVVNGSLAFSTAGAQLTSGTISGTGTIADTAGTLTVTGVVHPGSSGVGTLTLNGSGGATIGGATFQAALTQTGPSSNQLANSTNALTLIGATLQLTANSTSVVGQVFTILSSPGGITGTFNGLADGAAFVASNGRTYLIDYTATTVTLMDHPAPTLGTLAPTQWTANQANYSGSIAINGSGPFTVNAQSGLPPGLTATVTGTNVTFTGTPTAAGTFNNVQITVRDVAGVTVSGTFSITINPAISVGPLSPTQGMVGQAFNGTLTVSGGTAPYSNLIVTGLPASLTAALSGSTITVSGTPSASGSFSLTLSVEDSSGATDTTTVPLTVSASPPPPPPSPTQMPIFAVSSDAGIPTQVKVYDVTTGALKFSLSPFGSFTGGARVAVGYLQGVPELIVGAGPGGGPQVNVYDGTTGQLLRAFYGLSPTFTGGVFVAAGDVNGDGSPDIIVGADRSGGPQVTVWSGKDGSQLASFYAFDSNFTGGVRVAAGDLDGNGRAEIITGAGPGGGPQVTIVDGSKLAQIQSNGTFPAGALLASFYAFNPSFSGGVFVSGGVASGTQFNLILGAGTGGGPQVEVINGAMLTHLQSNGQIAASAVLSNFYALTPSFTGGVRIGFSGAFGSSGQPALLTAAGPGGGPQVEVFDDNATLLDSFFAFPQAFSGGVFISG